MEGILVSMFVVLLLFTVQGCDAAKEMLADFWQTTLALNQFMQLERDFSGRFLLILLP